MDTKSQVEVIDTTLNEINKGRLELSPQFAQQLSVGMIDLGTQLVAEVGHITVEYFKSQIDMYNGELNAYQHNQEIKSEERKILLHEIEKIIDSYSDLMSKTDDKEKIEQLKTASGFLVDKVSEIYMRALECDSKTKLPERIDILSGIKKLFSKK